MRRWAPRIPRAQSERGLAGTPEEVLAQIGAYAELGADTVYLQILDLADIEHLELIAAEVLPHV